MKRICAVVLIVLTSMFVWIGGVRAEDAASDQMDSEWKDVLSPNQDAVFGQAVQPLQESTKDAFKVEAAPDMSIDAKTGTERPKDSITVSGIAEYWYWKDNLGGGSIDLVMPGIRVRGEYSVFPTIPQLVLIPEFMAEISAASTVSTEQYGNFDGSCHGTNSGCAQAKRIDGALLAGYRLKPAYGYRVMPFAGFGVEYSWLKSNINMNEGLYGSYQVNQQVTSKVLTPYFKLGAQAEKDFSKNVSGRFYAWGRFSFAGNGQTHSTTTDSLSFLYHPSPGVYEYVPLWSYQSINNHSTSGGVSPVYEVGAELTLYKRVPLSLYYRHESYGDDENYDTGQKGSINANIVGFSIGYKF